MSRSEEFGSSPFLVGSVKKPDDDPLPHVRVSEGVLGPNDILFFASDLSRGCTGQALDVNGGHFFH